ncbi:MAG: histidine ammonia-lyase [Candidatus Egerieousia sp.]
MIQLTDTLSVKQVEAIVFGKEKISVAPKTLKKIEECYEFLKDFEKDKVIYGINTGFGPMAQWRIDDADLKALQYNIIRSHSTGAGKPVELIYVRAALLARLCTFLQAHSGVHPDLVNLVVEFINREIYPMIPEHGSVGASGDLVQLAHIALCLIGEGECFYKGNGEDFKLCKTSDVLKANKLKPFEIHIREGLSVTNGTSMMTGIGLVNLLKAKRLMGWSIATSLMVNEITSSYDDFMSEVLNGVKRHVGQSEVAKAMRSFSKGSKCLQKREDELFHAHTEEVFNKKVQSYYSLRCVPQVLGPVWDELDNAEKVLMNELNSACDNPIIDPENKNVLHGGNFHGDYVSYEMDKLKIAVTKLTMLCERQMNYLFHDRINGILPPFVNLGRLGLNYGLQASQFTATSTTAECQTLSMPMCVHSIPNNNDNQDVVSMGTNSAQIASKVIENSHQVMAIHLMAIVQAVDYLKIEKKLSPKSRKLYKAVREIVPAFVEDTPKYMEIRNLERLIKTKEADRL